MDELRDISPEELESGESQNTERQSLDDATYEPTAYIERGGDYQQAETIHAAMMDITQTVVDAAGNEGATPQPIPQSEDESLIGSQPKVRDDLDQATSGDSSSGQNQATPINLPGPQVALEDPGTGPTPPDDSMRSIDAVENPNSGANRQPDYASGEETSDSGPGEGGTAAADDWEAPVTGQVPVDKPDQPAEFEKPILNRGLEDMDSGLDKLGDLEGMLPGPGKIGNAPGEKDPGRDLLGGLPGLDGFEGGPGGLKNDAEGPAVPGQDIPGWESPFAPGKGPNKAMETQEGGNKGSEPLRDTKLQEFLEDEKAQKSIQDAHDAELKLASPIHTSGKGPSPDGDKILQAARDSYKPAQVDDPEMPPNIKDVDPDVGSGKDTSQPLSSQMEDDKPNPKFDQDQISNYPEDHIGGSQGAGKISEQYAEGIERKLDATAEKNAKIASTKPMDKAEQITDPPEPEPGKKSESSGKGS